MKQGDRMDKESRYELLRSRKRKKTISLQVKRDGTVVIQAPHHTPKSEIERFIEAKKSWLRKQINEQREREREKKSFASGETFLFLGNPYPLVILDTCGGDNPRVPLTFFRVSFCAPGRSCRRGRAPFHGVVPGKGRRTHPRTDPSFLIPPVVIPEKCPNKQRGVPLGLLLGRQPAFLQLATCHGPAPGDRLRDPPRIRPHA